MHQSVGNKESYMKSVNNKKNKLLDEKDIQEQVQIVKERVIGKSRQSNKSNTKHSNKIENSFNNLFSGKTTSYSQ